MSYEYLADRVDQLELPDLADHIVNETPDQWFSQSAILSFVQTAITAIAATCKQPNPFNSLSKQKTITPTQIHAVLTEWLYKTNCVYLDLIINGYQPGSKPTTDYTYLSNPDSAALVFEHITAEYEYVIYTKEQKEQQALNNNNVNGGNDSVELSTNHHLDHEQNQALQYTPEQLDLDVLLKATPYKPSLAESLSTSLYHLHAHFLDIEMYLTSLDLQQTPGSVLSPQQEEYYSNQALLSISPPTVTVGGSDGHNPSQAHPSLVKMATVDARLTQVLQFITQHRNAYSKAHVLAPTMTLLGRNLITDHPAGRLLSFLRKTQLSQLSKSEVTVVQDLLSHLNQDYQTRHNRLLQKMLTQTQTFLFSLKWKYLQQQQQQDGQNSIKPVSISKQSSQQQSTKTTTKAKPPQKKKGGSESRPIEDGANDDDDSDNDDGIDWSKSNNIAASKNIHVDNAEYLALLSHIVRRYKDTFKLISHLTPLHIGDLWMVSNFTSLVLGHGNERQLHRPRAKFQLMDHPRMTSLGTMADRGGRL